MSIKNPSDEFFNSWLPAGLRAGPDYKIDRPEKGIIAKLDQNEMPSDWSAAEKEAVLEELRKTPWHRYPQPFTEDVNELLAKQMSVKVENILNAPGSDFLIALVIRVLGKKCTGKVVIGRPSFPLYESTCKYEEIPYTTWDLDENQQFDMSTLPTLPKHSLLVLASPNNPTGSVLSQQDMRQILKNNPTSMVIADEAYWEFIDSTYVDLLSEFDNLLVLRTFSKTQASAGLRVGLLIGSEKWVREFKKVRVPYALNIFTASAVKHLLQSEKYSAGVKKHTQTVIKERDAMFQSLQQLETFRTFPSQANFLLLKFPSQDQCDAAYNFLISKNILVRNVSAGPGLAGCLRATIGTADENQRLLLALRDWRPH